MPPTRRMKLQFASNSRLHHNRVERGSGDVLIKNDPFNREYHVTICAQTGEPLYDMPVRAEPRGAVALALDRQGRIALIQQWRPVPNNDPTLCTFPVTDLSTHGFLSLEVPRGFPERGECGADAARRETCEELGVAVLAVEPLGWLNFNTSIMLNDIPLYAVLVDDEHTGNLQADAHEAIESLSWCTLEQLSEKISCGAIRCAITLAAAGYAFAARATLDKLLKRIPIENPARDAVCEVLGDGELFVERAMAILWELGVGLEGVVVRAVRYCVEESRLQCVLEKMRQIGEVKRLELCDAYDGTVSVVFTNKIILGGFDIPAIVVSKRSCSSLYGLDINVGSGLRKVADQLLLQARIGHCGTEVDDRGSVNIVASGVEIRISQEES